MPSTPQRAGSFGGTRAETPRLRKTAEWAGPVVAIGPVAEEDPGLEQL